MKIWNFGPLYQMYFLLLQLKLTNKIEYKHPIANNKVRYPITFGLFLPILTPLLIWLLFPDLKILLTSEWSLGLYFLIMIESISFFKRYTHKSLEVWTDNVNKDNIHGVLRYLLKSEFQILHCALF